MAVWKKPVLTKQGRQLIAQDLWEDREIKFTKIVYGSGKAGENEDISLRTALLDARQEFPISSAEMENDHIHIRAVASNAGLQQEYEIWEIGVYVKVKGSEDEILFSLAVAEKADTFPADNAEMRKCEILQEYYIYVTDDLQVTIEGNGAYVTVKDFEEFRGVMQNQIDDIQGQIGNLSELMREDKRSLVDAINEIAEVIRPLIEYSIATNQDIEDIINEVYADDIDWVTMIDIASDRDIELMIKGLYEDYEEEDGEDMATDQDILDIIAGTYVDEEEDEEIDLTAKEIERIVQNAF